MSDPHVAAVLQSLVQIKRKGELLQNGFVIHQEAGASYIVTTRHQLARLEHELTVSGRPVTYAAHIDEIDLMVLRVEGLSAQPLDIGSRARTNDYLQLVGRWHDGYQLSRLQVDVDLAQETPGELDDGGQFPMWKLDAGPTIGLSRQLNGAPLAAGGRVSAVLQVREDGALHAICLTALLHSWHSGMPEALRRKLSDERNNAEQVRKQVLFAHLTSEFRSPQLREKLSRLIDEADPQARAEWLDDLRDERERKRALRQAAMLVCIQGVNYHQANRAALTSFANPQERYPLIVGDEYQVPWRQIRWEEISAQWKEREAFVEELRAIGSRCFNGEQELLDALREILRGSVQLEAALPITRPRTGMFALPKSPPLPQHELLGRDKELEMINAWARSRRAALMIWREGGFGKTALVAHWLVKQAPQLLPDHTRIWWRYDKSGSTIGDFLKETIAALSGRSAPHDPARHVERLVDLLSERPFILVIDGLERLLGGYYDRGTDDDPDRDLPLDFSQQNGDAARLLAQLSRLPQARIILTTRRRPEAAERILGEHEVCELPPPPAWAGRELLRRLGAHGRSQAELDDYVRICRNNPAEIIALAPVLMRRRGETV